MKTVYILWHCYPDIPDDDNSKLLGVYSTKEIAQSKVDEKYKKLPGFNRNEGEFIVDKYTIDEDQWKEGFF